MNTVELTKTGGSASGVNAMRDYKSVRLGDVLEYEQPTKYIVQSTDYDNSYPTPVLTAGQSFVLGYTNEDENIYNKLPCIIFDDFTTAIKFVDFPFKVKSSAMKILYIKNENTDIRYLFYCMSTIKFDATLHKRYWISKYSNFRIPLPPLPIQRKIADALDEAQMLIDKRKQQIALLDEYIKSVFLDMFGDPKSFDEANIRNLCENIFDCPHSTPRLADEDTDYYCLKTSNLKNNRITWSDLQCVSSQEYDSRVSRHAPTYGDVVYSREGAILGIAAIVNSHKRICLGQRLMIFQLNKAKVTSEFFWQLMNSFYVRRKVDLRIGGAAAPRINIKDILEFDVFLPPIELQNRFADIVRKTEHQKQKMSESLTKLEENYQSISQRAFAGELFV